MSSIHCPNCFVKLRVDGLLGNRKVRCPGCRHVFPLESAPVELQAAKSTVTADEKPRPSVASSILDWIPRWSFSAKEEQVLFFGPGTTIDISGVKIDSPLTYFYRGQLATPFDASLIESKLPVSYKASTLQLPYWPNYRGCSPQQRRIYLDWMASGKKDPGVELGYVFIYFYGLERRAILDREDHFLIIQEVLRLLKIYSYSRSFQNYASGLLWKTLLSHPFPKAINEALIQEVTRATLYWNEEIVGQLLALYYLRDEPLPTYAAELLAKHDPRSVRSVISARHPDQFSTLFAKRYSQDCQNGIRLKASKRESVHTYRPASESLSFIGRNNGQLTQLLPNIVGLPSQFKPIIGIWNSAIDDLKAYDRLKKKSTTMSLNADAYEALPSELRESDHPDFDRWYEVINRHATDDGWSLIPVRELAALRGIERRNTLTKKNSESLLATADCMDLCLEPDARETGQNYKWDEYVSVFPREHDGEENLKAYHAASILLRLGMTIAWADGEVSRQEQNVITSHLERNLDLSSQESLRLSHLAHLLANHPSNQSSIASKLRTFPEAKRRIIGEFLVAIAGVDEVITPSELKALRKFYQQLSLNPDDLSKLSIGAVTIADKTGDQELVLNHELIKQIMSETSQVAELLKSVMIDDEPEEPVIQKPLPKNRPIQPDSAPGNVAIGSYSGLDSRYHSFLNLAITQHQWLKAELNTLAKSNSLMLSGAIDAINEWTSEVFGDFLFEEEGKSILLQEHVLNEVRERQ